MYTREPSFVRHTCECVCVYIPDLLYMYEFVLHNNSMGDEKEKGGGGVDGAPSVGLILRFYVQQG